VGAYTYYREGENKEATDNAVDAVGRICKYQAQSCDLNQVWLLLFCTCEAVCVRFCVRETENVRAFLRHCVCAGEKMCMYF
jgi:hypothetical protein